MTANHGERCARLRVAATVCSLAAGLLLPPGVAGADVFNAPKGLVSLEFVTVGNPGNPGELSGEGAGGFGQDRLCGSTDYPFQIGKYEVTNAQYCEFLNAVAASDPYDLYDSNMADRDEGGGIIRSGSTDNYSYKTVPGCANRPVNWVTFWDACRFVNWLHNDQGRGNTETGAYTLTPEGIANNSIARNVGWKFAVTSEDEWYKAAYHRTDGETGNYWAYPTASDTPPTAQAPPGTDLVNGSASYGADLGLFDHELLDVGSYTAKPSVSSYGTFDQGGNAHECCDTIVNVEGHDLIPDGSYRSLRGGSYNSNNNHLDLHAAWRSLSSPGVSDDGESGDNDISFRVVRAMVGVYRLWSPVHGRLFYTTDDAEVWRYLHDTTAGWEYEGIIYWAFADTGAEGSLPVYRFHSTSLNAYFYTISEAEKDYVIRNWPQVWTYEGVVFYAFPEGLQPADACPVYRFWSAVYGCHFYTTAERDRDTFIRESSDLWTYEGIAWYAYAPAPNGYGFLSTCHSIRMSMGSRHSSGSTDGQARTPVKSEILRRCRMPPGPSPAYRY